MNQKDEGKVEEKLYPENVGPFVPVHFLDGATDKVAIIDTERIGDVTEALLGILKSPHIHVERRDYP